MIRPMLKILSLIIPNQNAQKVGIKVLQKKETSLSNQLVEMTIELKELKLQPTMKTAMGLKMIMMRHKAKVASILVLKCQMIIFQKKRVIGIIKITQVIIPQTGQKSAHIPQHIQVSGLLKQIVTQTTWKQLILKFIYSIKVSLNNYNIDKSPKCFQCKTKMTTF